MGFSSRQLRGAWGQFLTDGSIPEDFKMPLFIGVLVFLVFIPLYLLNRKLSSNGAPNPRNRTADAGERNSIRAAAAQQPLGQQQAHLLMPSQSQHLSVHVRSAVANVNDQFAVKDLTFEKLLLIAGFPPSSLQEVCIGFDENAIQDHVLPDLKFAIRVLRSKLTVVIRCSSDEFEKYPLHDETTHPLNFDV